MIGAPRRNTRYNNFKKTVNERIPCRYKRCNDYFREESRLESNLTPKYEGSLFKSKR